jgi:hypothetical protein
VGDLCLTFPHLARSGEQAGEEEMTTPPPLNYQKPNPPQLSTSAVGSMALWGIAALFFLRGIVRHRISIWDVGIVSGIGLIVGIVAISKPPRSSLAWASFGLNAATLLLNLFLFFL